MLLNKQGKEIKVSDKLNSKTHPHVFALLHEVKEPVDNHCAGMFSLENRVKLKK